MSDGQGGESVFKNTEHLQRDIGRMEAEIKALHIMVGEIRDDLKQVRRSFDELKGGARFILIAAAGVGALITILFNWISIKH